jgi:hypothetical protein
MVKKQNEQKTEAPNRVVSSYPRARSPKNWNTVETAMIVIHNTVFIHCNCLT